jgi:positive regulator of sigma E activity
MPVWMKAAGKWGSILVLITLVITLVKSLIALVGTVMFAIKALIVLAFIALFLAVGFAVIRSLGRNKKKKDND